MRTRRSNYPNNLNVTIPRRWRKQVSNIVEPDIRTIVEMAERTMEELLRAPTEGYGEAIVLPEINADHFEIKTNLLQLVQANPFYGRESENLCSILMVSKGFLDFTFRNVPNDNEISRFTQKFEETFSEAWERFKELLRACPHHGFTELTQVDTFYNGLNDNEQDSLNAAAGGNLLSKTTREALNIIENKSKVRYSRNKPNASRINATSSKTDERIDKLADQLSTLVEIVSKKVVTPAPVKAVEESCVTCGGTHSWYNCPATDNNQASVCATTGTYNQANPPNRVSNQMAPPGRPTIPTSSPRVVERRTEVTKDMIFPTNNGITEDVQPPVVPVENQNPVSEPVVAPVSASMLDPKPSIPYPSRRNDEKHHENANEQKEKFYEIFKDMSFEISFVDALTLMPKFASTLKALIRNNKEKLCEDG
ncbi:reverse transcriptase domain-containing protein [Tanacetum coccineum]|uniref:Reverse transcriptase domain-containing protein n=1 Tax=Tanacetum coccineum TaxID=301880 RepID=A0ABQ4WX61_9ASTR